MTVIPAIDLLGGRCVRLYRGCYDQSKVYPTFPADTAERFFAAGARRIHLVDLDAARGNGDNRKILRQIRKRVPCILEVGGGIRGERDVEELLDIGIDRLILGTVLAGEPEKAARWVEKYGRHFIAGIDALDGMTKVAGWEKSGGVSDLVLARRAADMGILSIIYTNIARDGTMEGPDIGRSLEVAAHAGLPVIISGGIGGLEDCLAVTRAASEGSIRGIIIGKALYEGRLNLEEAIQKVQTPEEEAW